MLPIYWLEIWCNCHLATVFFFCTRSSDVIYFFYYVLLFLCVFIMFYSKSHPSVMHESQWCKIKCIWKKTKKGITCNMCMYLCLQSVPFILLFKTHNRKVLIATDLLLDILIFKNVSITDLMPTLVKNLEICDLVMNP